MLGTYLRFLQHRDHDARSRLSISDADYANWFHQWTVVSLHNLDDAALLLEIVKHFHVLEGMRREFEKSFFPQPVDFGQPVSRTWPAPASPNIQLVTAVPGSLVHGES